MEANSSPNDASDSSANFDPREVEKFERLADSWWDLKGEFRTLHDINPARLSWIQSRAELEKAKALDVGCGGGILSEAMAREGATVTGIDLSEANLRVARLHCQESGLSIDYQKEPVESLAEKTPGIYDVVACMELLEHVPDPALTVKACAALTRPGGDLFFSTINRNLKSWLLAIVGAEYVMNLLPRGTHEYSRLIRPAELAQYARAAGLQLCDLSGLNYNPFSHGCSFGGSPDVNYVMHCSRPE